MTTILKGESEMAITQDNLSNWFTYHPPTGEQQVRYQKLREGALTFAKIILECTPPSADQTVAIRKVREALMTSNASIACEGQ